MHNGIPVSAYERQFRSILWPAVQCDEKDLREYFYWNEVDFAGWQQVRVGVRVRVRVRVRAPAHDLTKGTPRALGRWRDLKNVQQQLAYTRARALCATPQQRRMACHWVRASENVFCQDRGECTDSIVYLFIIPVRPVRAA